MSSILGKFSGVIITSTFSSITRLKIHDIIDSANPNQPINNPVVYKSKQKNFSTKTILIELIDEYISHALRFTVNVLTMFFK